ncbi:hypothetical protein LL912_08950 [Niabella sp. CC-SYL272]|uniref:hypothetical protein n=1 Tax=Niabella agricola TaxID=2891571 RepID=UPI001F2D227C|nr:hypothetical protein [Niabella agricola]MCF3108903.1 hypothetical protein [Niabella agricola]
MKKLLLLLCFYTAFFFSATAQDNSGNPDDSKSESIIKTRRLLLDRLIADNKIGITLEKERLLSLDDEDYIAIYPVEFWLLSYWTNDYRSILRTTQGMDHLKENKIRIPPPRDYLAAKLIEILTLQQDSLLKEITQTNLPEEQKTFLTMHLKYLLSNTPDQQAVLNNLADRFIDRYPESNYTPFIKSHIRNKYVLSANGGSISFHGGQFRFAGALTGYYKSLTSFGLTFDLVRNHWLGQFNLAVGSGRTKTEMPLANGGTWPAGSKVTGGYLMLTVGKYITQSHLIDVAPIAGAGIFGVDPNENTKEQPELKGAGIRTTIAGSLGIIGDIKLKKMDPAKQQYPFQGVQVPFIRVGYEYIASPLRSKSVSYSGSVHKLTLGIGIMGRRLNRVY